MRECVLEGRKRRPIFDLEACSSRSELRFPILSCCDDWDSWFLSWPASKDSRDSAYVIFAAACWMLWSFRNNVTFHG